MTRADIIRMAREAGIETHERKQQARLGVDSLLGVDSTDKLSRFADLVAAAEREACAKLCDDNDTPAAIWSIPRNCAAAIRARSQQTGAAS